MSGRRFTVELHPERRIIHVTKRDNQHDSEVMYDAGGNAYVKRLDGAGVVRHTPPVTATAAPAATPAPPGMQAPLNDRPFDFTGGGEK